MSQINIKKLRENKNSKIVSSEEALKGVEKFNWTDEVLKGNDKVIIGELDDLIDQWHEGESNLKLHEFLGMGINEYRYWFENKNIPCELWYNHLNGKLSEEEYYKCVTEFLSCKLPNLKKYLKEYKKYKELFRTRDDIVDIFECVYCEGDYLMEFGFEYKYNNETNKISVKISDSISPGKYLLIIDRDVNERYIHAGYLDIEFSNKKLTLDNFKSHLESLYRRKYEYLVKKGV